MPDTPTPTEQLRAAAEALDEIRTPLAAYLALTRPDLSAALARWLEAEAVRWERGDCLHCGGTNCSCTPEALAVARALLGGTS
jgi:hypothetical protein